MKFERNCNKDAINSFANRANPQIKWKDLLYLGLFYGLGVGIMYVIPTLISLVF